MVATDRALVEGVLREWRDVVERDGGGGGGEDSGKDGIGGMKRVFEEYVGLRRRLEEVYGEFMGRRKWCRG